MPINFGAIGTALGGFFDGYDKAKLRGQRDQLYQQEQQDRQRKERSDKLFFDQVRLPGGSGLQSPGGGSAPGQAAFGGGAAAAQTPAAGFAPEEPAAAPSQSASIPPQYSPAPQGSGFSSGLQRLTQMGVRPEVAQGAIDYMAKNESGQNPLAINPTSGAMGRAQWLGPRKAALTQQYGEKPSDDQQAEFMGSELQGPERRTLDHLKTAQTGKEGYDIWGRDYERPGQAALKKAGVGEGGGLPGIPATDPLRQQAQQTGRSAMQGVDPSVYGRMSIEAIARRIDQAAPNEDPVVKMMALEATAKLLAPDQRERWEMFKQQNEQAFRRELQDRIDDRQDVRERHSDARQARALAAAGGKADEAGWDFITKPDGTIVRANKRTGQVEPTTLEAGSGKMGAKASTPLDAAQAKFWGNVVAQGGTLPAGLRRSGVVEQVMKEVPGAADMTPGDFIAKHSAVQADTGSLRNMQKMADSAISFEKLAEKNFDVALKLAPDAVPTELGPFFNRWVEQGEAALGDPSVPPYIAAMITGANEYAKVMSGSTGTAASTVDARKEARELFSPYMSLPQISQVIAVAKADMKNRENTLNEQVNTIKGRLGSTAPQPIAPAATPKRTGQESQSAPAASQPVAGVPQEGDTASNPQTGEKVVYRGGKWVPAP